jgi:hypothetical protein
MIVRLLSIAQDADSGSPLFSATDEHHILVLGCDGSSGRKTCVPHKPVACSPHQSVVGRLDEVQRLAARHYESATGFGRGDVGCELGEAQQVGSDLAQRLVPQAHGTVIACADEKAVAAVECDSTYERAMG